MKQKIIKCLRKIIDSNPEINPQNLGKCIYCGAALDEGNNHESDCCYLEVKVILTQLNNWD